MSGLPPALYPGRVVHERSSLPVHRFAQPMLLCLLEITSVEALARRRRFFSHNRFNLFAFCDRDHGGRDDSSLRDWVRLQLRAGGLDEPGGPVHLLAQPRVLGHVFNPLSVYFCHDPGGTLRAVIYQVHNTFGEAHAYVAVAGSEPFHRHSAEKVFRVSPFLPDTGSYDFTLATPGETFALTIVFRGPDGRPAFSARLEGRRQPFSDAGLLGAFARHPFPTHRTSAAIYRQAAAIWLKSRLRGYRASATGDTEAHRPF